jgi:hypothetical protein
MRKSLVATTALASSLVFMSFAMGSAAATPAPAAMKNVITTTADGIELVRQGGGGGGGGRGGGGGGGHGGGGGGGHGGGGDGGGGHMSGGGDGGGGHARGGGDGGHALKGGDGGGGGPKGGHVSRGGGDRDGKGSGRHAGGGDWKGDWKGGGKHHHHKNFRRFGSDIFVYGGGGYGYNDCGWLRRQAVITGSPYWWRRYQDCLYYD